MLNQIQFHIHEDEKKQQDIERALAQEIRDNYRLSIGAFERFIPSLADLIKKHDSSVSTLLCNKFGELNIINYNTGQVLYGEHPKQEIFSHYNAYKVRMTPILLSRDNEQSVSAMVVMGLGLGYHVEHLIREGHYNHIVVYEPNIDFFVCSLSSLNWRMLLNIAKERSIALYLQIGSDGANFAKDMLELKEHTGVDKLDFYKHLHNTVFNSLESKLMTSDWLGLQSWLPARNTASISESYLHQWAPLRDDKALRYSNLNEEKKRKNLVTLEKYFPNLYEDFLNYKPQQWAPCANAIGEVYLYHKNTNALFSCAPIDDAKTSFRSFASKPNKDGLLLSYKGKKLKGYLHYQLVEECESVLRDVQEKQSALPTKVKSIIQFGIGSGYGIDYLVKEHDVGMLFICEPNRDFFYASLYAIDWSKIISLFDEEKKRLYLNIGDDGSNLTNDLLMQFQSVGPYVLANTFFYQSYLNNELADAVARLREQLLVIISMGDYFDNAKYGIAHTRWALKSNVPFLLKRSERKLSAQFSDIPVFIVGNGPSLDGLLDILKEDRNKAIVISCGTVLQALHRNGITPDFHAEIETNRSTFDWLTRIDDPTYLKKITLLSCNGIHPDSASLFDKTLLALKQGEASTVSLTELDKKHPFALLDFAYPTVTNFVANFVTEVGFNQIYLFGTDMGFVSDTYHHSKSSGYYDFDGKELYSYKDNHSLSLFVPGNFKPWVKTKYEFKVSKGVLEQTFAKSDAEVYNLNDGAKINGAKPLERDFVLITSSAEQKQRATKMLVENAFSFSSNGRFLSMYEQRYLTSCLLEELSALKRVLSKPVCTFLDIENFVSEQRDFIVSSYLRKKSLTFYYLNGTFNYINSMFSKLLNSSDEEVAVDLANLLLSLWQNFINDVAAIIENDQYGIDNISPFASTRRLNYLINQWKSKPLKILHSNNVSPIVTSLANLAHNEEVSEARIIQLNWIENEGDHFLNSRNVCNIVKFSTYANFHGKPREGVNLIYSGDFNLLEDPYQSNRYELTNTSIIALMNNLENVTIFQKISCHTSFSYTFFDDYIEYSEGYICYGGPDFILLVNDFLHSDQLILRTGDRLKYIPRLKPSDLIYEYISDKEKEARVSMIKNFLASNSI